MITKSLPNIYVPSPSLPERTCHSSFEPLTPKNSDQQTELTELTERSISQLSMCSSDLYMMAIHNLSEDSDESLSSEARYDSETNLIKRNQQLLRLNEEMQREVDTLKRQLFLSGFYCNDTVNSAAVRLNLLAHGAVIQNHLHRHYHNMSVPFQEMRMTTSHTIPYDLTFVQKGETCKLAAFATVYDYFSQHGFCTYMPTYKKQLFFQTNGEKVWITNKSTSLREHAKKSGSVQGEIASPEVLETLAGRVNFSSEKLSAKSLNEYLNYIVDNINNGFPVVIFAQVNKTLSPDSSFTKQWSEHAAVAIGYDLIANCIIVVNHGRIEEFDINKLWKAASSVNKIRRVEIFVKSDPQSNVTFECQEPEDKTIYPWKWKDIHRTYDETAFRLRVESTLYLNIRDVENIPPSAYLRKSITPTSPHANFHKTLMVFKPYELQQ
ncbi:hypothetical protein [Endozoicomonas elysicola]|uniref:Uncharacterized protein n=1 Tax=Endozoicomonas elysicola TaxID=305900 RepID=A0A081KAR5_9GAMM|nr:hypothetical protein [Endozoicomonas elysicola]KEI71241.1 hypothetical protein GV64_11250 [Endozoicomonas elysicola]